MNNLQNFFILFLIILLTSCGSVRSVTIVRTIPPSLNIEHIKKVAVIPSSSQKDHQDSAQRIASIIRSILMHTNKFHILTEPETKKIYLPLDKNFKWEEPETIVELCKNHGIDAIFLVKLAKFQEDTFINTNFDSYYSRKENRYVTYAIEEDSHVISLDAHLRLSEGRGGKVLWEKKEDLNVTQTSPRSGFLKRKDHDQLLYSLINKSIQNLVVAISPQLKLIKRKVVFE